jgi:HK97 family phage prohead protease
MLHKQIHVPIELKLDNQEEGAFRATFSRFNVVDLDNDVTLAGAFQNGEKVRIAQWGHNWGMPVIGTGVIDSDTETAWVDGQFNLKMTAGRDTYEAVKFAGDLQEFSYGFDIKDWSIGEFDGREVRFLRAVKVYEVSPVLLGAGIGTGLDSIKSLDVLTAHGKTLADHRDALLAGARDLVSRYEALAASEAKEGRAISTARREQMGSIAHELETSATALRTILKETEPKREDDGEAVKALADTLRGEQLRFLAYQSRRNGARTPLIEGVSHA